MAVRDGWLFSFIGVPVRGGVARRRGGQERKLKEKCNFFAEGIAGFKIMRTFAPQSREIVRILK